MILKSIFFLFAGLSFLFIHSYNYKIEDIKTCIQKEVPVNIRIAYDKWIDYSTYLQNKANEVEKNELKINNGKRLSILVSKEDYLYTILHYSPPSIKNYVKQKQQSHQLQRLQQQQYVPLTSKERHKQFHQVIMELPSNLQKDAIHAKENLALFISALPKESHVSKMIHDQQEEWEQYKVHLNELLKDIRNRVQLQLDTHKIILEEKWMLQEQQQDHEEDKEEEEEEKRKGKGKKEEKEEITLEYLFKKNDHYISARDLYLRWSNEKIEMDHIASHQQSIHHQWEVDIEKRFIANATTLGPLRSLAEAMFEETKTKTIQLLDQYTLERRDLLLEWNTYSKTVLDDFMQQYTFSQVTSSSSSSSSSLPIISVMDDLHRIYKQMFDAIQRCEAALPLLKQPKETEKTIIQLWKHASEELSYTPYQLLYWQDLWEKKKLETKLFFKRSLNKIDEYIG